MKTNLKVHGTIEMKWSTSTDGVYAGVSQGDWGIYCDGVRVALVGEREDAMTIWSALQAWQRSEQEKLRYY